jgi:predicted nucleotidyltransferase
VHAPRQTDFARLLQGFQANDVQFIIVGGVAGVIHGSARLTFDLDIVYQRSAENLQALANALVNLHPYLRGVPPGLPFEWSARTLQAGLNFTLETDVGDLDLLGEIAGGGTYDVLIEHTIETSLHGVSCRCLDLQTLIRTKRAAGRPKDLEAIAELETILEEFEAE